MRIGIDVRYLSHGLIGGVHTYVAQLVVALVGMAKNHQLFLYADTKRPFELEGLPSNVTVRYLPWRGPLWSGYNDLFMWRQMGRDHLDVVHFPANYGFGPAGARTVITLHDAINILPLREIVRGHPKTLRTIAMMSYLHYCSLVALRRADVILTVSQHAARQIVERSGLDSRKIVPVPHAPTPDLRHVDDPALLSAVRERYRLARPFVLADALKNPGALVNAWRLLPTDLRASHQIVFFSRHAKTLPIVREAVANGEAHLLVRPSRDDLIALYNLCDAFVFPSWIEGFGIPLLEAMTCGAPVIASNRGAIPEVVGAAGLLADVEDSVALASHIGRVLNSPVEAENLRSRGFARAASFSWEDTARRILTAYEGAASAS